MNFWFPAVWTVRDRSIVAGALWNASHETAGSSTAAAAAISAWSIDFESNRGNFSDLKYRYTMVDEARQRYFVDVLRSHRNKTKKGRFPATNYSYHDFEFRFFTGKGSGGSEIGEAQPVTIGSAMVYGDRLAADASFSRHGEVDMEELGLLPVSYNIHIRHVPPNLNPMRLNLTTMVTIEERVVTAEGVYDPATGVLCMIGYQELAGSGSTDCRTLITVQFVSLDAKARGHGRGVISSLRPRADPLFFDRMDVVLFGMYAEQAAESVSRMDMESAMLVASATLPCVFTALQILRAKRSPEASAATSITMLVVLALGYAAPLVIGAEALFVSRGTEYAPFLRRLPGELRQAMLRAPALIASAASRSKAETAAAAERKALIWVCLPLYVLGGALIVAVHASSGRGAALEEDFLAIRVGPEPATLWEDLASSTGMALDGFLLPQVAMNAFAGGGASAVVSPWFYVGGTVVRAMPHVYDAIRARGYVPSATPSNVYRAPVTTGSASRGTSPCVRRDGARRAAVLAAAAWWRLLVRFAEEIKRI
ncbi:uncharacterized protein LOC120710132 [Panicum virgatum]|uniref:uncharacterized protein LOC120710132 n=1 Tax=Panicum virgatum TaxID=38727 RepID=UPI0019D66ACC|nr:uncharacterized protein LOC120710132 [Panicum virgatum]